jgi:hypothetical protein
MAPSPQLDGEAYQRPTSLDPMLANQKSVAESNRTALGAWKVGAYGTDPAAHRNGNYHARLHVL